MANDALGNLTMAEEQQLRRDAAMLDWLIHLATVQRMAGVGYNASWIKGILQGGRAEMEQEMKVDRA